MGFDSMKIRIKLQRSEEKQDINVESNATVQDILKKLDIKPDTVIVMHNHKPIPIDEILSDNQELTILQVSSGG